MKKLNRDELHLVKPNFHQLVLETWQNTEEVPYGIIAVDDTPPTDAELKRIGELNKKYKWE